MTMHTNSKYHLLKCEKIRISDLRQSKIINQKWAMLTCYDATSAKIFDLAKIPVLLVGDSAAQAVFGHKSTIPITMDELIPIARAVATSCERALVIADMPFGSYQESPQAALRNAIRFMKEAGVHGVKLEGGAAFKEHVKLLTSSGIPVMGHVGLTPQAEHVLSGYKVQGRSEEAKQAILNDAKALEAAGAFSCVVEVVPSEVGQLLASNLDIPIIGIGAGPHTDAQVMVWTDMAGFSPPKGSLATYLDGLGKGASATSGIQADNVERVESEPDSAEKCIYCNCGEWDERGCNQCSNKLELNRAPKFVERYADLTNILYNAARHFYTDVVIGRYPAAKHCYK